MRTNRWIAMVAIALIACFAFTIPTRSAIADDTWLVAAELKADPMAPIVASIPETAPNPLTFVRPTPVDSGDWLVAANFEPTDRSEHFFHQDLRPTGSSLELLCRSYSYPEAYESSQRNGRTIIVCVDQTYGTISREQKRAESEGKLFAAVRPTGTNPRMVAGVHEVNAQATAQQAATTSAYECLNGQCRRRR